MGLDLLVCRCAKPGHEDEWRRGVEREFAGQELTDAEVERFNEISLFGYERVGAPRVGFDSAANVWILKVRNAATAEESAAVLKEFHGHYALALVRCDGIPRYSNAAGDYGADETSFRGAWLRDCTDVLEPGLLNTAWNNMWPAEAVAYGEALLAAADATEGRTGPPIIRGLWWLFNKIGLNKARSERRLEEQIDIVRAAGRWFVFWGEQGHPIHAWY
jgi:hypothetical protein